MLTRIKKKSETKAGSVVIYVVRMLSLPSKSPSVENPNEPKNLKWLQPTANVKKWILAC